MAKITRGNVVYLISDQLDYNGDPIMLVGEKVKQYVKGGAIDTKSIYGRTNVTTLFGKYVDGQFVPYDDAKIWKHKENANDILSLSPEQLGAGPDVFDAIKRLTQNEKNGKTRKSQAVIEEDGEEMTLPSLNLARDLYFKGIGFDKEGTMNNHERFGNADKPAQEAVYLRPGGVQG